MKSRCVGLVLLVWCRVSLRLYRGDYGYKRGFDEGLKQARDERIKQGMRQTIRDLCDVLGIECTTERNAELECLDAAALSVLRDRIKSTKTWV
jgi:hypothetical protein